MLNCCPGILKSINNNSFYESFDLNNFLVVLVQFCLGCLVNSFTDKIYWIQQFQHFISSYWVYAPLFSVCKCCFFLHRTQKMQSCIWEVSGWVVVKSEPTGPHVNHLHLKVHKKVRYVYYIHWNYDYFTKLCISIVLIS